MYLLLSNNLIPLDQVSRIESNGQGGSAAEVTVHWSRTVTTFAGTGRGRITEVKKFKTAVPGQAAEDLRAWLTANVGVFNSVL